MAVELGQFGQLTKVNLAKNTSFGSNEDGLKMLRNFDIKFQAKPELLENQRKSEGGVDIRS